MLDKWTMWLLISFISLAGSFGNILWKLASNHIGQVSWTELFDITWDMRTLFTPIVFIALTLMFISRFASIVPTGYMQITHIVTLTTVLSLVFTAILDSIFLTTKYPLDVWIGVAIGILSIYFLGRSIGWSELWSKHESVKERKRQALHFVRIYHNDPLFSSCIWHLFK